MKAQLRAFRDAVGQGQPRLGWKIGINDPKMLGAVKGAAYAELIRAQAGVFVGATYYHINTKGDIDPQYHIGASGDAALSAGLRL